MKHTQRNINHITYKNMHDTISKYVLSLGLFVLLAGDCNPTPDPIAGQALFKKLAFTVDKVNYDFDFEAEPAPGTLSINDQSVNLANAQQTASGATLVVDGKTYGIAYKNINDTVYLTLTLPDDVGSLPTSITLNTLLVSEKSTLVDQNGAPITEGQSLSRRNDAFIAKIISVDGKKNTIYNIQLKKAIATVIPTITKLVIAVDASQTAQAIEVNLETLTALFPAGSDIPSEIVIKEIATSPQDLKVVKTGSQDALSANSKVALEDDKLLLSVTSQSDQSKSYEIAVIKEASSGSVLSSITLDYLNDDDTEAAINLTGVSTTITLEMGVGLKSDVMIDGYQLADDSKEAAVSLSEGSALSISTPTEVTLENNSFKLYVTPVGGGEATEYTITFVENLYKESMLTSIQIAYGITSETVTFTQDETERTISLASGIGVPSEVTLSEVIVSKGASVKVGGTEIATDESKTVDVQDNKIALTVTSQSGVSIDYTIGFDFQTILNSLVLEVEGEAVMVKANPNNPSSWIGEIGFDNAFTGSSTVKVTSLSLSDEHRARIIPTSGEPVEVEKDKTFSLNEYSAMLEVYVEGDEEDKQAYTLSLQRNSIMMKSYSQQMLGTEIPPIGIALLDTLKDPNNPTEVFDYPVLTISGLQKQETSYSFQIGGYESNPISSTASGELILMKRDMMPATDILMKTGNADITLLTAGAERVTIGKYEKSKIHDWKDLQGMRMDLEASYTLENDIELPSPGMGGLPKEGFDPIGTSPIGTGLTAFTGSFAGESRMISNFSINRPEKDHVGLFGYIQSVESELTEVKDVKIAISDSVHGRNSVGCVVGVLESGTITGVEVTGGKVSGTRDGVGGVAGGNLAGTITNSYAMGDVSGTGYNVGGVAGSNNEGGTIMNSYATGDVSGRSGLVGGVAGWNYGTITNSYATGDVSGTISVGGVAGNNGGTITNSYAMGDVSGTSNIGGVAGRNIEGGTITNSYAMGDVSGTSNIGGVAGRNIEGGTITNSYAMGDVSGNSRVGGVAGSNNEGGTITNSYATGIVSGDFDVGGVAGGNDGGTITNSYATGNVSGNTVVGGVAGNNGGGTITNSYATGNVSGNSNNIGGVAGWNQGTITNSYATGNVSGDRNIGGVAGGNNEGGTITNSYATGNVSGNSNNVGGVTGDNLGGTITNSYATGDVSGNDQVGGVAGANGGTITNSYALGGVSRIEGSEMTLNWVVGLNDAGSVTDSYYPYRAVAVIDDGSMDDPSADSVRKTEFENLKKMSITGQKGMDPFNGWNFDRDWEWVSETNQAELHNREALLWPLLRLATKLATGDNIPSPPSDFVTKFRAEQINGQEKALEVLQDKTADDWE